MTNCASIRPETVVVDGALPIGSRALLLAWRDLGGTATPRRWRLLEAGLETRPPRAALMLQGPEGGARLHLLMMAMPTIGRLRLEAHDGGDALECNLATMPPLAVGELASALPGAHRRRLVAWLLGVCPPLFRLSGEPDLAFLMRDVMQAVVPAARLAPVVRRCRMLDRWTLLETAVPDGLGQRLDAFVLDGSGQVRRALTIPCQPPLQGAGRPPLFLGLEDTAPSEAAMLVLVGSGGLACRRLTPAGYQLPTAAEWAGAPRTRCRPEARAALLDLAALLAERNGCDLRFASLIREIQLFAPVIEPMLPGRLQASLEDVIAAGRQLLVVGRLTDHDGMVAGLRLRRLGGPTIDLGRPDWVTAPDGASQGGEVFLARAMPPAGTGDAHALWHGALVLRSGLELALGEPPARSRDDDVLERLLDVGGALAETPAAVELLEQAVRAVAFEQAGQRRIASIQSFGPPLLRPRASLALPFRRASDAERAVAMLACEQDDRAVELVLVALDPDAGAIVEAAALAGRYARALRLVRPTAMLAPMDVPRLALAATEAPVLLTLGYGIVPRVRGWLDALLAAIDPPPAHQRGVGVALAGLPMAGAGGAGPLPSLEIAAAVRRDALGAAGGLPPDWLDPDHRDADLTLRLLAAGFRARVLEAPACIRIAAPVSLRSDRAARLATALDTRRLVARAAAFRKPVMHAPIATAYLAAAK